jgi:hypothetical protein
MNDKYARPRAAFQVTRNTIGNVALIASSPLWVIPLLVCVICYHRRNIFKEQLW